jgi:hypothetical protein
VSTSERERPNAPTSSPTPLRARRLVGRDGEIREVSESVASAPVTTLLGPGGVGKTALAMTVAAACSGDFPGGVTVVWLGSVRSADLVAAEVAAQLGLPRSGGQSYEDALTRWLSERDALVVIDNCEHVVSSVADLVDALTARLLDRDRRLHVGRRLPEPSGRPLENVFAKIPVGFESFSIDVERLIDAGNVVVMQGHYVAKGKETGKSVRAAVAHVLEGSDGKIVRFDQYVDSATINPILGA